MRVARVIGRVVLSQRVGELPSGRFVLVVPEDAEALADGPAGWTEPLVAFDGTGAGLGQRVALSEGREAAQPFVPARVPVDAYCAAILDAVNIGGR